MANQGNPPRPFAAHDVAQPYTTTPSSVPLPEYVEDAIGNVAAGELVALAFRIEPTLRDSILNTLPGYGDFFSMRTWFERLFGHIGAYDNFNGLLQRLRNELGLVVVPDPVRAAFYGATNQYTRERLQEQYLAQTFLRGLLTDIWPHNRSLADAFLNALRPPLPPPAFLPVAALLPQPQLQSATDPTTSTAAPTSTEPKPRLYCPECGRTAQEGDFRMIKSHWFEEHYRSNRSAVELEEMRRLGELGPWTAEEAKMRGRDKDSIAETDKQKKKRKQMKSETEKWRIGMQTDPVTWEKKAQTEDGYSDIEEGFIDYTRRNRARGRKPAAERKDRKKSDKKAGKKGGK